MDEKRVNWIGSSKKDLLAMPEEVRRTFGYALSLAQNNLPYEDTKMLTGFGLPLVEILEDDDGDTYRAVYTARLGDAIYVLHCFKKKSTKGRNIPKRDKETIEARLAEARRREAEEAKHRKKG
ncbi:MAG TPA: type II toxin-antitoxin system RelE/ParE family toxin [Allosphingosinicella sp.]|jgi:phage-related protein